ncbi:MAG: ester cyclase [Gemmatimonadota bacterium]|jgi:predicted ester cyclase
MGGSFGPFPPTHEKMEVVIIGMHRFERGKVAETWTAWDNLAVPNQLGLMPDP